MKIEFLIPGHEALVYETDEQDTYAVAHRFLKNLRSSGEASQALRLGEVLVDVPRALLAETVIRITGCQENEALNEASRPIPNDLAKRT